MPFNLLNFYFIQPENFVPKNKNINIIILFSCSFGFFLILLLIKLPYHRGEQNKKRDKINIIFLFDIFLYT